MRNLSDSYLAQEPDLAAFFRQSPQDSLRHPPETGVWNPDLVSDLSRHQTHLGGTGLIRGNEIVVMTGQQPGLFAGPLYTVHKAITAIRVAALVSERFGMPCLPVFWLAGDDHDFDELGHVHLLTKTHQPLELRYTPEQTIDGFPMHRVPLEPSLHSLIERAASEASGAEFRREIALFLHDSLDSSDSFEDWTARILARLFAGTPLVIFSPRLPVARQLAIPIIEREITEPLLTTRLLNEAGKRLEMLGYPPQIVKGETECGFFLEVAKRRRKVLYEHGIFRLPEENVAYNAADLLALLREAPERFSPNVALRAIVQQFLFPVAAYIGGPGEVAYWAQFKTLFEVFDLEMPCVYPRARCTLTSVKLNKLLGRLGLTAQQLLEYDTSTLVERVLRTVTRNPALESLARHRGGIETSLRALSEELTAQGERARIPAERLTQAITAELDRMERLFLREDQTQVETIQKQVERLCAALAPFRKPQERVYTVFSFLFEHGWVLIARLLREMDVESFAMNEVEL